jgi:NAD(P)-dependent dehydrogenase (short-subunit alcohol dehydrogenase family)
LQGKTAWVTGASGGIGSGIVAALRDAGCTVVSTDLSPEPAVTGERIVHRVCDVTRQSDIDAVVAFCRDELGGLDVLVNNAAILNRIDVFDVTREFWQKVITTNLDAYFFCAQAAARLMRDQGRGGSIVNTASINADLVNAKTLPYCVSKGGIRTLTFALAVALGEYGIRVNGVAPGTIVTPLNAERWKVPGAREAVETRTPLGRLGVPSDVGPAVAFLASDEAAFITGSILPVNGGRGVLLTT